MSLANSLKLGSSTLLVLVVLFVSSFRPLRPRGLSFSSSVEGSQVFTVRLGVTDRSLSQKSSVSSESLKK